MQKKKVVISGTCHGGVLKTLLETNPGYAAAMDTVFVPNFQTGGTGFAGAPVDALLPHLDDCNLLIYHDIKAYNFAGIIPSLPVNCAAIRLPYITSRLYWPGHDLRPVWLLRRGATAYIPFACRILNGLIEEHRDKATAKARYLDLDMAAALDLEAVHAEQMDYLRSIQQGTIFNLAAFTEAQFRRRQLFHVINHPAIDYFIMIANAILDVLQIHGQVEPLDDPFTVQQTPLHPSVIDAFGITWCNRETRYNLFEKRLTFEEYVDLYIDASLERLEQD